MTAKDKIEKPETTGAAGGPPTIVQLVHIDETGDSYYRMRWPARDLAVQDPALRIINLQHNAAERYSLLEQADLAVLYQSHDIDLLPVIKRRRDAGKKTIVEYNDNFYAPATPSPAQEGWSSPLLWNSYEMMVRAADALLVTGPGLLELFSSRFPGQRIEVLENHLPFQPPPFEELWQKRRQFLEKGRIVIGWAGSVGHMADLIAIAPLLRKIAVERPNVTIAMMGNESIPEVLRLAPGRLEFVQWGTMAQYFSFLSNLHIGIAPALDTPYNRCRSDIKAVEYSSQGAAPLLQNILPYHGFIADTGADSFTNLGGLTAILNDLLDHPEKILPRAKAAYEYVSAKRVGSNHRRRLELYREFMTGESKPLTIAVPSGYHEIAGTPESEYPSSKTLQTIQKLVQEKQVDAAAAVARQAIEQNPYSPDLTLQYLRIMRAQKKAPAEVLIQLIDQSIRNFPADVRFQLLKAAVLPPAEKQLEVWNHILGYLKALPPAARFFQKDVLASLTRAVGQNPKLTPAVLQAVAIYPGVMALRIEAGRQLESAGKDDEALEHFKTALALHDALTANVDNPPTDRKYILTWCEALDARIRQREMEKLENR